MKKSVLIALLGLSTTEALKIGDKEDQQNKETKKSAEDSIPTTGSEFIQAIADLEAKQDEFDHEQEMEDADEDADSIMREAEEEEREDALAIVDAEIDAAPAAAAAAAAAPAAAAAAAPVLAAAAPAAGKKSKNKDSSDEECACAPQKETTRQSAKIKAKQQKRLADAKAAKASATTAKAAAEEAIAAANLAKRTSAKNVLELAHAAEEAIAKATIAENKSISKQTSAKAKISINKSEGFDLRTKMVVKNWEETVVSKHEVWETYKSIKKNFRIAVTNVKLVRQNLKAAENKVVQIRKTSALNPKDIGAKEKIKEGEALVQVIRKQLLDADNQKTKIREEMNSAQTKAREASVASAKAKAAAEKAFRNMVIDNNKTCSACRLGKEKIAKRRLEIDGAIKQETKLKAQREAEKRRQSRGRGGRRAGLVQETIPTGTVIQPLVAETQSVAQAPIEPIAVVQQSKVSSIENEQQPAKSHHKKNKKQQKKASDSGAEETGEESD